MVLSKGNGHIFWEAKYFALAIQMPHFFTMLLAVRLRPMIQKVEGTRAFVESTPRWPALLCSGKYEFYVLGIKILKAWWLFSDLFSNHHGILRDVMWSKNRFKVAVLCHVTRNIRPGDLPDWRFPKFCVTLQLFRRLDFCQIDFWYELKKLVLLAAFLLTNRCAS